MSKIIDQEMIDMINTGQARFSVLVRMDFEDEIFRFSNSINSIYWEENESEGVVEYVGLGGVIEISSAEEITELQANTLDLTISGIDRDALADVLNVKYKARPVFMYAAPISSDGVTLLASPVLFFAGRMDHFTVSIGKEAVLRVSITSRLADWERERGGRFNHTYQQGYVDSTDMGFEYVDSVQGMEIYWGRDRPAQQGSGGGGVPGGGSGPGNENWEHIHYD